MWIAFTLAAALIAYFVREIVLTGYGRIATAVESMRCGAVHYLLKPCSADQVLKATKADYSPPKGAALRQVTPSLAKLERQHVERVFVECDGNLSKAARVLGIHRRTLQ
jgi:two-component system response regulator RegA